MCLTKVWLRWYLWLNIGNNALVLKMIGNNGVVLEKEMYYVPTRIFLSFLKYAYNVHILEWAAVNSSWNIILPLITSNCLDITYNHILENI